ncbi:flagellar motor switch phosphatase FliY [Halalkalibacter alkaliphilus]|uniref:Flagellar motor switch phosphatase FliY n=2 Tax=Bacillaceae TaxID=186817 RepID=A0A9X2A3Z1_9BACI|nr:flagellar motor switch phosphatase FliY [Halalkalibacter alkaliphilus]MCL7746477.1 flagellar motor switch phosphatase FliY [Halalkalibacter alkaliphilus]
MNDDMLSQDEINELLKGVTGDNEEPPVKNDQFNLSDYLSDIEKDALGEIGNISFGSAATALSTLLNQKVEITTPLLSIISRDKLEMEFPQPHVAVHVEYTEGFQGINLLVIQTRDAAIIADLMLGGDGMEPSLELTDMHVSAVQEAMNQMMGSASTSMSTIFNKKVDISPPGIDLMDVKKEEGTSKIPEDEILVKTSFRLKVGDLIDSNIMQLVTVPFAKALVEELMNPSSSVTEETESPVEELAYNASQAEKEVASIKRNQEIVQRQGASREQVSQNPQSVHAPYEQRGQQHLGGYHERDVDVQPAAFSTFETPQLSPSESNNLNMLLDIPLQVTVELGRTKRSIKEILEFTQGSIIELDKLAGEPVDILVNQKLIAKGEVVVIDENFGVRVTDIVSQEDRIRNLK